VHSAKLQPLIQTASSRRRQERKRTARIPHNLADAASLATLQAIEAQRAQHSTGLMADFVTYNKAAGRYEPVPGQVLLPAKRLHVLTCVSSSSRASRGSCHIPPDATTAAHAAL
jgi:hypothetical protein